MVSVNTLNLIEHFSSKLMHPCCHLITVRVVLLVRIDFVNTRVIQVTLIAVRIVIMYDNYLLLCERQMIYSEYMGIIVNKLFQLYWIILEDKVLLPHSRC